MKKLIPAIVLFVGSALLSTAFVNCSKVDFVSSEAQKSSAIDPTGVDPVPVATPDDTPTVCDPFTPGSKCAAGDGLKGNLYYLLADDTAAPRAKIGDIISNGELAAYRVQFTMFDVGTRSWTDGFPGPDGLLMNSDGKPLNEWFAFDLKGFMRLNTNQKSDDYQFALFSDDGSILSIDDKVVINFDNQHSPAWKCAAEKVALKVGDLHDAKLQYFQGPRNQIALRLMWRPWSDSSKPCSDAGGFTPVPAGVLYN